MREIKFRFWDKEEKEWLVDGGPDDGYENDIYDFAFMKGNNWTYISREEARKRVEVIQYTGLKDKNGVEIYEGDIICCSSGKEDDYLDFRATTGAVEYIAPYFRIGGNELAWCAERLEVIGNIYENKKLLEAR